MSIPVAIVVQARAGGTRYPGKVLAPLLGQPMLLWQLHRLSYVQIPDVQLIVATPPGNAQQPIAELCWRHGYQCLQPVCDEQDVLGRYAAVAEMVDARAIIRITADCPLIDPVVVTALWDTYVSMGGQGYLGLMDEWPDGQDCEVFDRACLQLADREAVSGSDREHVTPWIKRGDARFETRFLSCPFDYSTHQYSVDTLDDMHVAAFIFDRCLERYGFLFGWREIAEVIRVDLTLQKALQERAPRNHAYRDQRWREKGGTTIHAG